jgi:hypothetical protein
MIQDMREDQAMEMYLSRDLPINRRRVPRSVFIYPVEFELFSSKKEPAFFNGYGYLKDIALSGAGLQFEDNYGRFIINEDENTKIKFKDKYGRFNISEEEHAKVHIFLSTPREEKVNIFAHIQWIEKVEGTFHIKMGIGFKDLEDRQLAVMEKLIGLKGKDHNMMWTLWDQYKNHNMMWTLWE